MGRNRANRSRTWRPRSFAFVASVAVHGLLGLGLLLLPARPPAPIPEERPIEIVFYAPEEVEPLRRPPEPITETEPISVEIPPATFQPPPSNPEPEPELVPEPTAVAVVAESTEIVQVQPVPAPQPARSRVVALGSFASDAPRTIRIAAPAERETTVTAFEAPGKDSTPETSRTGKRGPVATTGAFDVARAVKTSPRSIHAAGTMAPSGFGDATAIVVPAPARKRVGPALNAPVAIVSKPTPLYTDEARKRHIEGEVVLEVTFVVSGALRVHRVVKGLGHGLDEAAIEAAKKIRFKPARKDGRPIDYTATVSVVFRLA